MRMTSRAGDGELDPFGFEDLISLSLFLFLSLAWAASRLVPCMRRIRVFVK